MSPTGGSVDRYIGLMSGTSLDGVDAVLVEFDAVGRPRLLGEATLSYPSDVREAVLALQPVDGNELDRAARLGNRLADLYAETVARLLAATGFDASAIRAIGCHGQTIRHAPEVGYTIQIGNLARLAERAEIDVIGDFRSRDVAAGGQGAPLVPAFHLGVFGSDDEGRVVINIGGIANLSVLEPDGSAIGFDCGPGNMLLDAWVHRHHGHTFDADGAWAASGTVVPELLTAMLAEPFFAAPPPKSTGRDLFDLRWLDALLARLRPRLGDVLPVDVQATLLALTVEGIASAVELHAQNAVALYVCGGGARNGFLMQQLGRRMPRHRLATTDALGLGAQQVEAAAFAWLARQFVERHPGNLPGVTGAAGLRVLGALYPV
ncbi:anhydro-N-acetylmuramic acid kinase [Crenobacter sp. SG2305]|uniref:anhydro-N-acetylmuramic acid kinase n=1 Tax=Crenobacter oryzisoli TaxID=3056844 RepID=UPI0025AB5A4C|nr:anhydro-N-acetylmuramic acid kinase [Crenobacter sp. SG2305]MDN0081975.1 anhydro-N-acetylmuramic acid kinase [Crenobacter sp. SG2305]